MSVSELVAEEAPAPTTPAAPAPIEENEEFDALMCRIPRSLMRKLKRRAFELSENRRKRVSQTDIVIAALRKYLDE